MSKTRVQLVIRYLAETMRDLKISSVVLIALISFLGVRVSAQSNIPNPRDVASKFDEYGMVGSCDHSARLDNFAIQIQNEPGSTAYIAVYAPERPGKLILEVIHNYLVNIRGLLPDRIKTVYAGRNDVLSEPRIQLWIAPPGVRRPQLQKFNPNIETFKGLFADNKGWDDGNFERGESSVEFEDFGTGPGVMNVVHASIADVLKHQKNSIAYVVAYNGEDAAPGAWRRIAESQVEFLKRHEVESRNVKVIFGGTVKETKVQLWVAPAGEPPPVSDAGPEPPPGKTVELVSFADSELSDSKLERSVFKRIVDTLREFPTVQACVIVTFGTYEEPPAEPEIQIIPVAEATPVGETPEEKATGRVEETPEPLPADLAALVEKWRTELTETHKISSSRLIILFDYSKEFSGNHVVTWVVPPGAALPNPAGEEQEHIEEVPPARKSSKVAWRGDVLGKGRQ